MPYDLKSMSSIEVINLLLNKEKRNKFLEEMLRDEENYNEVVDGIVDRIMPYKSRSPLPQNYQMYVTVNREYERYINGEDWHDRELGDFDDDFYSYAYYGIRGYIEQTPELRKLIK